MKSSKHTHLPKMKRSVGTYDTLLGSVSELLKQARRHSARGDEGFLLPGLDSDEGNLQL